MAPFEFHSNSASFDTRLSKGSSITFGNLRLKFGAKHIEKTLLTPLLDHLCGDLYGNICGDHGLNICNEIIVSGEKGLTSIPLDCARFA